MPMHELYKTIRLDGSSGYLRQIAGPDAKSRTSPGVSSSLDYSHTAARQGGTLVSLSVVYVGRQLNSANSRESLPEEAAAEHEADSGRHPVLDPSSPPPPPSSPFRRTRHRRPVRAGASRAASGPARAIDLPAAATSAPSASVTFGRRTASAPLACGVDVGNGDLSVSALPAAAAMAEHRRCSSSNSSGSGRSSCSSNNNS